MNNIKKSSHKYLYHIVKNIYGCLAFSDLHKVSIYHGKIIKKFCRLVFVMNFATNRGSQPLRMVKLNYYIQWHNIILTVHPH